MKKLRESKLSDTLLSKQQELNLDHIDLDSIIPLRVSEILSSNIAQDFKVEHSILKE